MSISDKYIQYGVSSDIAFELERLKLPVTTFKNTSIENLIEKYDLESTIIEFVKNCIERDEIEDSIVQELLEKSSFTCCICKGQKSDAYIIHHIVDWSKTKDNSYKNLAVLCPNDHDLAHRKGIALTNKITEKQVRTAKDNWEAYVKQHNIEKAQQSKSDFDRLDKTKITFLTEEVNDNEARTIACSHPITPHTKFVLRVTQTVPEQEFVTYLLVNTNEGDAKWIGFGTPMALRNVYASERVYRIGKPGKLKYDTVEYIIERVHESGLLLKGKPTLISKIRLWGWKFNVQPLIFEYALID